MTSAKTVICPETGKVLQVKGNQIKKHIMSVWGVDVDKDWEMPNKLAEARILILLEAISGGSGE